MIKIKKQGKNKSGKTFIFVACLLIIILLLLLCGFLYLKQMATDKKDDQPTAPIAEVDLTPDANYVKTLNMILKEEEKNQNKPKTMFDTIELLKTKGYSIENQTLTEGILVWDSVNNRIALLKNNNVIYEDPSKSLSSDKTKIWKMYNSYLDAKSDNVSYAIYLKETEETEITNLTRSLDVGNNEGIDLISYIGTTTSKETVIRSNGKELKIDASLDSIKHFGSSKIVTIEHVSSSSYWEYGQANVVDMANGRLVITNNSGVSIETIFLNATNENYDNIILATQNGAELPSIIAREEVELPISGNKKIIATVQEVNSIGQPDESKTEHIYLYGEQTAYEEQKGYENVSNIGNMVLEAPTDISSTFTITVKDGDSTREITINKEDLPEDVKTSKTADSEKIKTLATMFESGVGTKDDPYIIATEEQFMNIDDALDSKKSNIYFKLGADMDMSSEVIQSQKVNVWSRWELFTEIYDSTILHLDLCGKTIYNLDCFIFSNIQNLEFENGVISFKEGESEPGIAYYSCGGANYPRHLIFKDLVLNGQYSPNMLHYGPILAQSYDGYLANDVILLENIVSNVNINNVAGNAYTGGLLGYVFGPLTIKDCTFNGSIQSAYAGGFINPMNAGDVKTNENNTFNGKLLATSIVQKFGAGIDTVETIGVDAVANKVTISTTLLSDTINMGDEIIINHTDSSIVKYAVSIMVWTNKLTCTTVFNVEVDASSSECHSGIYKNYFENKDTDTSTDQNRANSGWYMGCIWREGDTYFVYSNDDTHIKTSSNATIIVYGYDESNNLVTYQSQSYSPAK